MSNRSSEDRWWTIPNAITMLRLVLIVPVVALVLAEDQPLRAAILAVLFGATDWVDGFLARLWGQASHVGAILDVLADRLGIVCIAAALAATGAIPWLVMIVLVAVDAVVAVFTARTSTSDRQLTVSWIGKIRTAIMMAGTAAVMFGLAPAAEWLLPVGQVLLVIGVALHVVAGAGYLQQLRGSRAARRQG
ncbi:CDP-alcohol phosphatidyltransferase family protein [Arthrobacter castelli]|uniref:CDP-alcohol phosphatidyltransferase family protein n=1 Tax=Arthrobacter castelli TaxID=271431 RepID=UPI000410B5E9|nr:CDP-alcohol phosphatidyltransferase family protein [Arthrobacter castelli]